VAQQRHELELCGLEDIDKAVRCNPHEAIIHLRYAEILQLLNKRAQSLKECGRVVDLEAPLRHLDGRLLERNGHYTVGVRRLLLGSPQRDPNYWEVRALMAQASWVLDFGDALDIAQEVLGNNPLDPRALAVRGAVRLQRGEVENALRDFQAVLSQEPQNYLAQAGYARAMLLLGRPADALAGYTHMLDGIAAADWQMAETHLGRARALAALGKTEEARQALADAEDLAPGITEAVAQDLPL
jgi:predicted Zn-dependent protease